MSTKLISAEQLSSLAETVKGKINVLDTVPATVNGGLWLDGGGTSPVIKLFYNGSIYALTPQELHLVNPQLTLSATEIFTGGGTGYIHVSYLGEGRITFSSDSNSTVYYNPDTRDITVNNVQGDSTVTVSLSSSGDCAAAQVSFIAHETAAINSISFSPSSITMDAGGDPQSATIIVDANTPNYTISLLAGASWGTLNGNTFTFSPPYSVSGQYPFVCRVSGDWGYRDATITVQVNAWVPPNPIDDDDGGSEDTK